VCITIAFKTLCLYVLRYALDKGRIKVLVYQKELSIITVLHTCTIKLIVHVSEDLNISCFKVVRHIEMPKAAPKSHFVIFKN